MRNLRSSLCHSVASALLTICLTAICVTTICTPSLSFAEAPDRIGTISSGQTVPLAKSLHPKAQPQYDQGRVEPSRPLSYITLLIAPSPSQQKALDQLLAQQQDPHSPNFHKWLTPARYADRFGLSQNDLNKVTEWLRSQGFKVTSVGGGRNSVIFSGTAAQVETAFGTEMHNYKVDGEEHIANSTPVMLPAALSGVINAVMGLHDFRPHPALRKSSLGAVRPPHANYYDEDYLFPNYLAPGDIATIYDISPLYGLATPIDGTGEKLAIMGQTDILLADINDFRNGFQLSAIPTGAGGCSTTTTGTVGLVVSPCTTTNFAYVLVGSESGTISPGDIMEADLDVEWSGAVARNAQIIYVNAPETESGVNDSLNAAINPPSGPPLAPVISMSYGLCEAQAVSLETLLQQGNAEGVTIMDSSGDTGAAACDYGPTTVNPPFPAAQNGLAVNYPASSPEVTGVGGTEISISDDSAPNSYWGTTIGANGGTALRYIPEITWNDDVQFAQFCESDPTTSFCTEGGSPPVSGWVDITSQEMAQKDIWISAGGGGASNCYNESVEGICASPGGGFPQPTWQSTITVSGAPAGVRWVPDVSGFASPNFPGYILCTPQNPPSTNTSTCSTSIFVAVDTYSSLVGGTSASTPVFAGIVTLLNQYLNGASSPGLGNINTKLYELAASSPSAFHPTTSGTNVVYCEGATPSGQPSAIMCPGASGTTGSFGYNAANFDTTGGTGYNVVTGLGSVDANALFTAWNGTTTPPVFTLGVGANSLQVTPGQTGTATITVTVTSSGTPPALTFTCSEASAPALASSGSVCTVSPATPTNAGSVSLQIPTFAPTAQLRRPLGSSRGIFFAALLPGLFGIIFTAGSRKRTARGLRFLSLIVVLGFSTLWLSSCSSNSSSTHNPGTPAGSYSVSVTASTGGANPVTASTTVTLVVQ
jgi:subtilase family serine protease